MINLVIADDEERICKLIVALGEWDKIGIQVIGSAGNGLEALNIIRKEKVDILITDIRMPGCDGLELISRVKAISPDTRIVIISGYANFEYAQAAVKFGVKDYLLKPINKKALNDSLEKIAGQIETDRKTNITIQDIQREHKDAIYKIRSIMISDLLTKPEQKVTETVLKEYYHFNVHAGLFQAFTMKIDNKTDEIKSETRKLFWDKMHDFLENRLQDQCFDLVMMNLDNYMYGIMNFGEKAKDSIRKGIRDCFNQILVLKELYGEDKISIGLGSCVKGPEDLAKAMRSSFITVEERLIEGTGKFLDADVSKQVLFERKLLDKFTRDISQALETLDNEGVISAVEDLQREAGECRNVHGWELFELVNQAGTMFVMRLDIKDKKELLEKFRIRNENCSSQDELFMNLRDFLNQLMKEILAAHQDDSIRPVRIAKQYINNHYQEQITLEGVSEQVGLTVAYFSVLFKKETQVGFAKYLANIRLEEAKRLLRETNLSVADICRQVGYNDLKHFTHIFEKDAGIKPTSYRKLYG